MPFGIKCQPFAFDPAGDFPESEKAARESLALPIYAELTSKQIRKVAGALARAIEA